MKRTQANWYLCQNSGYKTQISWCNPSFTYAFFIFPTCRLTKQSFCQKRRYLLKYWKSCLKSRKPKKMTSFKVKIYYSFDKVTPIFCNQINLWLSYDNTMFLSYQKSSKACSYSKEGNIDLLRVFIKITFKSLFCWLRWRNRRQMIAV